MGYRATLKHVMRLDLFEVSVIDSLEASLRLQGVFESLKVANRHVESYWAARGARCSTFEDGRCAAGDWAGRTPFVDAVVDDAHKGSVDFAQVLGNQVTRRAY